MSPTTILKRIGGLLTPAMSEHLDSINDALRAGRLKEPVPPMSVQELTHAIREFRSAPVDDWTIAKLSRRFVEASVPRAG